MQEDMQEHQQRAARIETLVEKIATFPDARARATSEELVQTILDMYGEGLAHILDLAMQTEAGHAVVEAFASDDLVASLFMLHGLHPIDLETRIARALVDVRPYLKSHGGNVELIKVEDNVAYLRLEGTCKGCAASTITLKTRIEDAIYKAAPDLDRLDVEGVTDPPPLKGSPVMFVPRRQKDGGKEKQEKLVVL